MEKKSWIPYYSFSFLKNFNFLFWFFIFFNLFIYFVYSKEVAFIVCISSIVSFMIGHHFGEQSERNNQKLIEGKKQKERIKEEMYVLKNKSLVERDRENAFWNIFENEYLDKETLLVIIENITDMKQELKDLALEKLYSIKQKARDP
jgi:ABC-type bacteriocin/lantibiotic exporter with double-glycine peptidase domain